MCFTNSMNSKKGGSPAVGSSRSSFHRLWKATFRRTQNGLMGRRSPAPPRRTLTGASSNTATMWAGRETNSASMSSSGFGSRSNSNSRRPEATFSSMISRSRVSNSNASRSRAVCSGVPRTSTRRRGRHRVSGREPQPTADLPGLISGPFHLEPPSAQTCSHHVKNKLL
jgi:hypothetical protein